GPASPPPRGRELPWPRGVPGAPASERDARLHRRADVPARPRQELAAAFDADSTGARCHALARLERTCRPGTGGVPGGPGPRPRYVGRSEGVEREVSQTAALPPYERCFRPAGARRRRKSREPGGKDGLTAPRRPRDRLQAARALLRPISILILDWGRILGSRPGRFSRFSD